MPNFNLEDTIAAIATPLGEGGISVIRISGPESFKIVSQIFTPKKKKGTRFISLAHHPFG